MPVGPAALEAAAARMPADRPHVPLTAGTVLPFLADRLPMAVFANVHSAGDFALHAGLSQSQESPGTTTSRRAVATAATIPGLGRPA